jgi:hypothetical protein
MSSVVSHSLHLHPPNASIPAAPGRLAPDLHALAYNFPMFSHGNTRQRQAPKQFDAPRGLETCSCARAPGELRWRGCNHRIHPLSRLDACDTAAAISPRLWFYCRVESWELLLSLLRGMQGYRKAYSLLVCLLFQLPPARADPRAGDPVSVVSLLELASLWEYSPLGVTMAFAMVALVRDTIVAIWRTGTRRVTLLLDKRTS